jgi:hypothetical protein
MVNKALVSLSLALLACGGETYSLGDGKGVGAANDGAASDAGAGASDANEAIVDASAPNFEAPKAIEPFASDPSASDDDPSLTQDLREIYFNSKRDGGKGREDVWFATRARATDAWSAPQPASELNSDARETGIALSPDGLTVWFSSDREGGVGGLDVYTATRSARSEPFRNATLVAELSSQGDELVSASDATGTSLYFARREDEDDDYDLFLARRPSTSAPFGEAIAIDSLNSDREESDAFAVSGGARLLFTRSSQIVLAESSGAAEYRVVRALDELNSDEDERDPWATDDLTYVVFSSKRTGTYLLYEARLRD